ncbi:hypothetical protein [Nodosilinea sp. FACHB-13]|uniref:hypothetical protein n=1 Tax=Cyanophyceae TaxID=3028117 RepID=UPI001F54F6AA
MDYLGLGGRRYIGNPKQPTITICRWANGAYETQLFRQKDNIVPPGVPNLRLTANEIFEAGQ